MRKIRESMLFRKVITLSIGRFLPKSIKLKLFRFSVIDIYESYLMGEVVSKEDIAAALDADQYETFVKMVKIGGHVIPKTRRELFRKNQLVGLIETNELAKLMQTRGGRKNIVQRMN